jgi:hypothetical protein
MKFIYAILFSIIMVGASFEVQAQSARKKHLDRKEQRLDKQQERIHQRNPRGIGRHDNRVRRKSRKNDRRQDRVENRIEKKD